ncbi:hypothetical protein GXP67_10650 [Rhodocytophaga rosea]|uniref:Uncharacterized protein n=1 Tax=Rhodocytophaga rosea TaxID=2704465 RepID=A0A6C0GH52_9BACT|nr:hypothetical protein [Rhodocytophaga rosea]QHT67073.1 hypothetical protein GXP67_10650 [Rhodocytophaga rosea]
MNLLPYQQSILVLPFSAQEIILKLSQTVKPFSGDEYLSRKPIDTFVFNGWVRENKFRISRRITHAENFLPLILGKIETTSKGSIVFVTYRIFPTVLFFMGFFCLILLGAASFYAITQKDFLTAGFMVLITLGIYAISILDFNQKVKLSKNLLEKTLSQ